MKSSLLRIILLLLFMFITVEAWAQSSVWMVRSSKATVYVAGSVHMLRPMDYPLPAEFFYAYDKSHKIVFEILPGEMEKPENTEKYLCASVYGDGTTLREHVSAEAYAQAESFCEKRKYPMKSFAYMRPTFFLMTLTVLEMNKFGADLKKGVDYFFKEKALKDGKSIGGLETADEQINFLISLDAKMDGKQILESIKDLKQIENIFPEMIDAWKRGDENEIARRYLDRMNDFPEVYRSIIVNRNKKWLKNIEEYLNGSENVMVVAGVAHLAGDEGVINLLRRRGYKVVKLQK